MIVCIRIEIPVTNYGTDRTHFGRRFCCQKLIVIAENDSDL